MVAVNLEIVNDTHMSETFPVPHQLTSHTKLLHKVAIIKDGKVLLLQRSNDAKSRPGCWDLPGGNSEWPVAVHQPTANLHQLDISREIWEETGLQVPSDHFQLSTLVLFRSFFEPTDQVYTIICGWQVQTELVSSLAVLQPNDVVCSHEHQGYTWAALSELSNYDFGGERGEFVVSIAQQALGVTQS